MKRPVRWLLLVLVLLAWAGLGAINVYWSDLNQDEGWYLYAARSVSQGQAPYRDFAFTQGPVFPYVYSLGASLVAANGVVAGRWITFLLGGLTLAGAYRLAGQRGGPQAALFAAILLGINVYQSQFTTTVKTYALAGALLVWGLVLIQRAAVERTQGTGAAGWANPPGEPPQHGSRPGVGSGSHSLSAFVGGILLALAAGTRLSAGIALPVACVYLLLRAGRGHALAWFWAGVGGAVGLVLIYGPFLWMAPEAVSFGLLGYHAGRVPGDLTAAAIYKAGFVSRMVQSYFVVCVAIVALVAGRLLLGRRRDDEGVFRPGAGLLWWVAGAVSLVHLTAPFPYDDYQVMVYPIVCAALGISLVRWIGDEPRLLRWVGAVLVLASLAAAFASPVNQAWVLRERDRIWWRLKEAGPIAVLQEAGQAIRAGTRPDELLLTQDIYLAVEADRPVPRGMEMGPFSYFPELDQETAAARRVTNHPMLLRIIRTTAAPMAAVSGYGFAVASPAVAEVAADRRTELLEALEARYQLEREFPHFGQAQTRLGVFRRKIE